MAKAGTVWIANSSGSSCTQEFRCVRASFSVVVQAWPEGGIYWRSSVQMGHASGASSAS
ncbi:hypothetical protein [Neorhizobium sp. T7_12]|uniref:hypothetical protein n=1 Tax=Neorhizobium sp. T7_12 TaxID=2093832 RepID=UPI00352F7189